MLLVERTLLQLLPLLQVVTLEVALEAGSEPVVMAELMPRHWADFIRSGPIEDVRPLPSLDPSCRCFESRCRTRAMSLHCC